MTDLSNGRPDTASAPAGHGELLGDSDLGSDFESFLPLGVSVAMRLKQAIVRGQLKPGTQLSENRLAAELSVSRTPVREALKSLEQEGLVTVLPGRKVIVSVPTERDIDEIYDIRLIVETEALRRITPARHDVLEGLEGCIRRQQEALRSGDRVALGQTNTDFHMLLIDVLNNHRLRQFIDSVYDAITRFRIYSLDDDRWSDKVIDEHRHLTDLLKAGDTEAAVAMLTEHLTKARDIVKQMFTKQRRST